MPLATALALSTVGCLPEDASTRTQSKPSKTEVSTNGIDKLEGGTAFTRATKATVTAGSVRVRGQVTDESGTYAIDFRYIGRNRARGTLRMSTQRIELIRLGSVVYFKGNKPFLQEIGGKDAVRAMSGKYVKTSSKDDDFADIQSLTNLGDLLKEISKGQGWTMGKLGNIGATPAVTVTTPSGDRAHIAAQGSPYLLRLSDSGKNRLDFLSYNERVALKPPPANLVIDLSG